MILYVNHLQLIHIHEISPEVHHQPLFRITYAQTDKRSYDICNSNRQLEVTWICMTRDRGFMGRLLRGAKLEIKFKILTWYYKGFSPPRIMSSTMSELLFALCYTRLLFWHYRSHWRNLLCNYICEKYADSDSIFANGCPGASHNSSVLTNEPANTSSNP